MATTTAHWKADVKVADPSVLPEYTLLPDSPAQSVVSPEDHCRADFDVEAATTANTSSATCIEGLTVFKLLWMGMLAIVLPPVIVAVAATASAGAMVYGCGKILEGIGRGLTMGPELLYEACVSKRAKTVGRALRSSLREERERDVESGQAIAI